MSNRTEGEGMRFYIELFARGTGYRDDVTLVCGEGEPLERPARLLCMGDGEERFLISVIT
jgi:hypothetical protein